MISSLDFFHYFINIIYIYLSYIAYKNKHLLVKNDSSIIKLCSIYHNSFLIVINLFITLCIIKNVILNNLFLFGNDPTIINNNMKDIAFTFLIFKYYDFIDTLIIVAKGNSYQLTYLHIFHHSSVSTLMYYNYKLIPYIGDIWFLIFYNSFIHVLLYSYYLANLFDNKNRIYNKLLTQQQIVQFVAGTSQQILSVIVRNDYPYYIREINIIYGLYMLYLFYKLYIKKYIKNDITLY